jgi:hypothetical protein
MNISEGEVAQGRTTSEPSRRSVLLLWQVHPCQDQPSPFMHALLYVTGNRMFLRGVGERWVEQYRGNLVHLGTGKSSHSQKRKHRFLLERLGEREMELVQHVVYQFERPRVRV